MDNLFELTMRERSILDLIAKGKRNRDIALELQITTCTVRNTMENVLSKTRSTNRTEAVLKYLGVIQEEN